MIRRTRLNITTNGQFTVTDINGVVTVSGRTSTVTIANFDEDTDHLVINGQPVTVNAAATSNNTGGTSTASDGSHAANLALLGQHMASSFVAARRWSRCSADCRSIVEAQQPLLTQPHA